MHPRWALDSLPPKLHFSFHKPLALTSFLLLQICFPIFTLSSFRKLLVVITLVCMCVSALLSWWPVEGSQRPAPRSPFSVSPLSGSQSQAGVIQLHDRCLCLLSNCSNFPPPSHPLRTLLCSHSVTAFSKLCIPSDLSVPVLLCFVSELR